jgi:hypothetical protein
MCHLYLAEGCHLYIALTGVCRIIDVLENSTHSRVKQGAVFNRKIRAANGGIGPALVVRVPKVPYGKISGWAGSRRAQSS